MRAETAGQNPAEWIPVACLEVDPAGRVRWVNEAACRLFGHSRQELANFEIFDLMDPAEVEKARLDFVQRLQGNLNVDPYERNFVRRDGARLIAEVHLTLVRKKEDGSPDGFRAVIVDITARREAVAVKNGVLEASMDAIVVIDKDGLITHFNPAAEEMFQYRQVDIIGRKSAETLIPLDLRQRYSNTLAHHLETGESVYLGAGHVELRGLRADGSEFPIEICTRKLDLPGRTLFAGFMRDISQRVRDRAEMDQLLQQLDLHRVRWETTLRQLPGGVLVVDTQGRIMLTNDWMQKLLKKPLPDVASYSQRGVMQGWRLPDGSPCPVSRWPPLRVLVSGETVIREELRFDLDDQAQAFLEVSAAPIVDRDNHLTAAGCIFFDVTAQRLGEISLRISEARYREIFEQDITANFILSARMQLLACNSAAVSLFGFESKGEMFSQSAAGKFPAAADRGAIRTYANEPGERRREYMRLHRCDGVPILVAGTIAGVRDNEGRLIEIHGHLADVTDRRKAERRVSSLSLKLSQVQNEERRKLSYDLHDSTGQILSALSMNLGLIEKNIETNIEKALAYLAESKDLARECLQHIRLVSYSLHPPLLDELGMNAALKWFIEGFSKRSSIDVTLEVKEDLGRLDTLVEITLFRIVQEALTNVHRHSGSKTATVRLWRNDTEITLSISDRGRGIEAGNSRTGGVGAGVGLASIRQQLSLVDGGLAILPGPGTTLVATIPYKSKTRDN